MAFDVDRPNYHKNLSYLDVKKIRALYLEGATQQELRERFGVSLKMIYNIVHVKSYKDVPVPDDYFVKLAERTKRK